MHTLHSFGLHNLDGVYYLVQGKKNIHNFIGLRENPKVQLEIGQTVICPHNMKPGNALTSRDYEIQNWLRLHPALNFMLPSLRKPRLVVLRSNSAGLQQMMVAATPLCGMVGAVATPLWSTSKRTIIKNSTASNISPILLTGARFEHTPLLDEISQIALSGTRMIIVLATSDVISPRDAIDIELPPEDYDRTCGLLKKMDLPSIGWHTLTSEVMVYSGVTG